MKKIYFIPIIVLAAWMGSCAGQPDSDWLSAADDVPPGPVSNVKVFNQHGGANITYTLPADKDLMGVKAVYSLTPDGELMERYASAYTHGIVLEGFGDTVPHTVHLYALDKYGNQSAVTPVAIKPLISPVELARQSLQLSAAFGGIYVKWDNPQMKDLAMSIYVADSISGEWVLSDTHFFSAPGGMTVRKDIKVEPTKFRVILHDRWNNYTAPMDTLIDPLFEQPILGRDKTTTPITYIWKQYGCDNGTNDDKYLYMGDMRNDATWNPPRPFYVVHNGPRLVEQSDRDFWNPFREGTGSTIHYIPGGAAIPPSAPCYFTIDMGRKATYSRMMMLAANRTPVFGSNTVIPVEFVVWGSNSVKQPNEIGDGSRLASLGYWTSWAAANGTDAWKNDWAELAHNKIVTVSGSSIFYEGMPLSEEDNSNWRNGYHFEMDPNATGAYRYLRFEILQLSVQSSYNIMIDELEFWGAYVD
jgi:hypothetical protein